MEKLDLDWTISVIWIKASLCSCCYLNLGASLLARNPALTHAASKVLDVIKVIWPCFNHWENWAAPHNPTLEGDKIQSLIREVIDWCNLIGREAVEGMWLIAFVHYTCWSWLAIFFTFICCLISVVAKFSVPPPNWSPSGTCPCPVSRLQVISSKIYKNHCQTKTWSTEGTETLSRERNKACLWNLHSPPFPSYTFPPAFMCSKRSGPSQAKELWGVTKIQNQHVNAGHFCDFPCF